MHVALNAQLISTRTGYRSAGVSTYSARLLEALGARADADLTLTAFVNDADFNVAGVTKRRTRLPLHQPLARIAWEQTALPLELRGIDADLVHGLVNVLPLWGKTPGVVTVHDLSFVRLPEVLPAAKRAYLTRLCSASCRRARRVIAVSRQTADDVHKYFAVPTERIEIVPNGVGPEFTPDADFDAAKFRRAHNLPERFVLYLGTLEPRKNLEQLLRAFAAWRSWTAETDHDVELVVAGGKGWFYDQIFATVTELRLTNFVRFPGYIPTEDLVNWYRAAEVFVYPSLMEGFGLPVLEAMACGTPVICSDLPSLRDVAGDAALFFHPQDEPELVQCLERALISPSVRHHLRKAGLERAAHFSWARTAEATLDVYRAVAG
jgi:glycosyltransferase involved in cell wall biosynthesis